MTNPPGKSGPSGGGALIALFILVGALVGAALGQPSIGVLAGSGIGVGLAVVLWRRDRGR